MKAKKTSTKFTILFNRDDPVHVQAADILNRQPQRGKAHYIAQAIVHYDNINCSTGNHSPAQIDEQLIETVARRMMSEMQMTGAGGLSVPIGWVDNQADQPSLNMECKTFDEVMDSLGEDGLKNVADALDMFRRK